MKKFILFFWVLSAATMYAQSTGSIVGKLTDKEYNNEPMAFANVLIKGTTKGTTSDFDGLYAFEDVAPGTYTVVYSFVGYETQEITVEVVANKVTEVNVTMAASSASLDEVVITTTTRRESEVALLLEQKKAVTIKESIGAQRLSKVGITDAATATTKISGVTQSEGSGDIYIRGLGDRYLSTTMNGLPIPSDDVQNKNIDLGLFSTNIINSIGISKTYSSSAYADQSSGTVDVTSKRYTSKGFSIGLSGGINTAVAGLDGDFRSTLISTDVDFFGYHTKPFTISDAIIYQQWDPTTRDNSSNFGLSLTGSYRFDVFGKQLSLFATASHSKSFEYYAGEFRTYRANILDNAFPNQDYDPTTAFNNTPSVEEYRANINTTAYIRGDLKLNNNHKIGYNTLFVNTGRDILYEQGRNGLGYVFDQQPQERGAFTRDQNYKQTILFVNQLMGEHQLSEKNKLSWAGGYNFVLAEEPNRIRNEAIIIDQTTVTYADVSDFSQRKSTQRIEDNEFNGKILNEYLFGEMDEDENRPFKLNLGANFRYKERDFRSQFIGVSTPGFTPGFPNSGFTIPNVDVISTTFVQSNFSLATNPRLRLIEQLPDVYSADLTVLAGFASLDFGLNKKFSGNLGLRYERDEINTEWNVKNFQGPLGPRVGNLTREYNSLFPSVNLKYELNGKNALRFASSLTQTLPEFKEFSPFQYEEPTGRVIQGNPNLERSTVFNVDAKWEYFPKNGELISATAFFKNINDPINLALTRGSSGNFEYNNTGDKATVFGIELEGRFNLIENEDEESILSANANLTHMWFNQDLFTNFQYFNRNESDLQGASDFIFNGALSYNNRKEKEFNATLSGNYASDKIFALGSPEDLANSDTLFNDEIIEKGFFILDAVISKDFSDHITGKLVGRNLLNPSIQQTQQITRFDNTGALVSSSNEIVQTYKKGVQLSFSITYKF